MGEETVHACGVLLHWLLGMEEKNNIHSPNANNVLPPQKIVVRFIKPLKKMVAILLDQIIRVIHVIHVTFLS